MDDLCVSSQGEGSFNDAVGVGGSYPGLGRLSMSQVYNGDAEGHRDRMSHTCFPKQERREVENGIPRDSSSSSSSSSCRAEDSPQGQSWSPTQDNGVQPGLEEQDPEKDKDDSLTLSRKKRGRRKLERPTKCEREALLLSVAVANIRDPENKHKPKQASSKQEYKCKIMRSERC